MIFKRYAVIVLALAAVLIVAEGSQGAEDVEESIDQANRKFMELYAAGDAKGVANLYTSEGMLLPPGQPIVKGRSDIQEFWQAAMESGAETLQLTTVEVEAIGDSANEVGRYAMKAADGTTIGEGHYIVIWKNVNGDWKLHRDIWNSAEA